MTDPALETKGRARGAARQDRPDAAARRVAALEAEVAALRRALAEADPGTGRAADRHGAELARERAGRAAHAAEARSAALRAEARHGREMAAGRADLAASEGANGALRRANAELAAGRAALREGEARWRGLFERMQEGFALCEMVRGPDGRVADYRFLEVNAAWERHAGIPRAAAQGRPVSELLPAEEAAFWVGTYARVVETGGPARVERRIPSLGRWFEATIYATGEPGRAATLLTDVTGRKAAEARRDALVELGDRLRDLRDPGEIARAAAEVIGRALGASRAGYGPVDGEETLRVERDWTGGPEVASVAGEWRLPGYWAGFAPDLRRGEAVVVRDAARDPRTAGAVADAHAAIGVRAQVVVPVVEAGRVAALLFVHEAAPRNWAAEEVAFVRDAAGRAWAAAERARAEAAIAASEARWRGLFERMAEGFALCEMVHDAEGRAVDFRHIEVNGACERLTGLPASAVVGRLASEAVPGIERFWTDTYARVAETGEPAHVEHRVAALGRWFEVLAYRVGPGRVATLLTDVTARKAAEARRDALVELGDRLRDLRDPAEIAHAAAMIIGRTLGADRAGYGAVDADEDGIRIERDWTGDPAAGSVAGSHRLSDYWPGLVAALRRDGVVAIGDVARDPRTAPHAARFAAVGVRACVHAPVVEAGRVSALLYVHAAGARDWTEEEVAFVWGAADRAWAAAERARAERRRALLVNELNHRVKNTLAVVQSLAAQTARGAPDLPSFGAAFQARLMALARAHDLLTRRDWAGAPLHAVARAALEPLAGGRARLDLSAGAPGAVLPPGAALALAMALHELATNALKHGALSVPDGRVTVACGAVAGPAGPAGPAGAAPVVEWVERGGPAVAGPPARRGFGLRLLGRGLAAEAGVGADLRFEPEGVRCTLRLPPPPVGVPAGGA